ncbi:DUF3987 domain-containing protein [Paramagnetospirillum marisnigri]|nr:DUF3987 domain-containing protein [Paramagnetospirillum marisnigri]
MRKKTQTKVEKDDPRQLDLIALIEAGGLTGERREALRGILATTATPRTWRGDTIIPPGSLLDRVVDLFARTTDFPLELPAFVVLHSLAAYLLDKGVEARVAGSRVQPDLWSVLLAPSGAGKTKTVSVIERVMPLRLFPEAASAAKFMEALAENNRAAWFQDEWAQTLKRIETQTYCEELREYLLKLHDGKPLARRTVKGSIEINDPALVILGTTVHDTFLDNVSAESMLDGFSQRFGFIVGEADPNRTPDMFPIYRVEESDNLAPLHIAWKAIAALPLHPEYVVSPEAEAAFANGFQHQFQQNREMPSSFFRRVMWRAFKYALVYHVLLGKADPIVDAEDIGWAVRVAAMHLADARRLLDGYRLTELEALIVKAETLQARLGRRPTKRELVSGVRGIRNGAMANFVLEVMTPVMTGNASNVQRVAA